MPVIWEGLDQLVELLGTAELRAKHGMAKGTNFHIGGVVYPRTQELVPVDTGALKLTGHWRPMDPEDPTVELEAQIVYGEGDPIVDYAVLVHEILSSYHRPPTQAKYVEQPVIQTLELWEIACTNAVELEFRATRWSPLGGGASSVATMESEL